MLLIVPRHSQLDARTAAMEALGYEARGEFGIAGRRFFVKGGDERRSHHVHAYEPGHPEIERHLVFRDYLCAHPQEAARYAALKAATAAAHPHDVDAYTLAKAPLIIEMIERARAWRARG